MIHSLILVTATSVLLPGTILCQEPAVPLDIITKLQSVSERIRACGEQDITPVDSGSTSRLPFKLLEGPPMNVTWDVKRSESIVKPFRGVVEFVTYSRLWAPDELMKKNRRLSEFVVEHNLHPDMLTHRYTFESIPNGEFNLTSLIEIGSDLKEMPEPRTYRCWQLAAGVTKPE